VLFRDEIFLYLAKTPRTPREVEYQGLNFDGALIKQGITPIVNRLKEKGWFLGVLGVLARGNFFFLHPRILLTSHRFLTL